MAKKGIRIAAALGIGVGSLMLAKEVYDSRGGGYQEMSRHVVRGLTGYDMVSGAWNARDMTFTIPAVAGCGLSMVASKVGLNRYTPKGVNI